MIPPPPLGNEPNLVIHISIDIDKIIDINENDGYFKTKLTIVRKWVNSQITFQDLKRNPTKNKISEEDWDSMWIPWTVFENIEDRDDWKKTDVRDSMIIIPNQEFHYQMDDHTNFRKTRLFKGEENVIENQRQFTVRWVCDFDMRWYPFDNQKCFIKMNPHESSVMLKPSSVTYQGPKELTQHIVKNVSICQAIIKGKLGIIVEFSLGRPLFGTTLSVFMPTSILLILSQMVRVFGNDHLEMVIEVNLTLLLVLATL